MTKPIIGLTTYSRNEEKHFALPAAYIDAVRRADGIPILLPPGETHIADLLLLIDGLILTGGGDIDPAIYDGDSHETIFMVDAERDKSEIELVRQWVELEVPMLNICRGAQVVNVALGGTLIEHLPDVVGEDTIHRAQPSGAIQHPVAIQADSQLSRIMGQTEVITASWHHQAVKTLAPGLKAVANAPDGTIEAFEMPNHPWLIALQWHPELTAADDTSQQKLFDALVKQAAQGK